ncbi:MAG: HD domain-containing phosphohydrolase [Methylococcaceae bacterium]
MLDISKISELNELNVLYVEDDAETREELELVMQGWFSNLYVAANGKEGLALYQQYKPDIVISDIQMPKMNGLSMSADIKHINPNQEIIILSAYNDVEYLFRALELGIKHYITKPISIERLLDKQVEIRQQMQLENEVKRNRKLLEQYKLLVDEKAIVAKIDLQGKINYVNQQFCTLSGYSEKELLGQHYLFTFSNNQQESVLEELKLSVLNKKKWQGLLKKTSKCGDTYIVDVTVVTVVDENNQIEEFVALMVDMTEVYAKFERLSLNLQQDLHSQQHYFNEYERAIELGTSLCVLDTQGKIISANKNFSTSLNCQQQDLIGRSFSDIVLDCNDFKQRVLDKIQDQGVSSRVIRIGVKPGCERTLSTVIVGIHDEAGDLHSLMSLNQDITDSITLNEEIIETQKELIYVMGEVVENHSEETGLHIKRVAQISELIAEKYGLSSEHAAMIKIASPMHDIGKVGIPDEILHKPGRLTRAEFQIMKKHTDLGYKMLNKMDKPLIKMAATIAHQHHEYFNGKGYPLGLAGNQIAIEARIVGLVDVFDALGSHRCYKQPWDDQQIMDYLIAKRGKQFDPELVDLFLENSDQIISIRDDLIDQNLAC